MLSVSVFVESIFASTIKITIVTFKIYFLIITEAKLQVTIEKFNSNLLLRYIITVSEEQISKYTKLFISLIDTLSKHIWL